MWYDYLSQKFVAKQVIGCREEPIAIILQNGHSIVISKEQRVSLLSTANFLRYYFRD